MLRVTRAFTTTVVSRSWLAELRAVLWLHSLVQCVQHSPPPLSHVAAGEGSLDEDERAANVVLAFLAAMGIDGDVDEGMQKTVKLHAPRPLPGAPKMSGYDNL